ncbi:MAG: hypothetical protein BroJett011_74900 [Chloroflexota bacterium]|nr:MAG: hypothetical protein BroJett011_74900 [Chloroflexota bacterium]
MAASSDPVGRQGDYFSAYTSPMGNFDGIESYLSSNVNILQIYCPYFVYIILI